MSGNHTPTPWSVEVEADYEGEQPKVYVCSPATQCDLTVVATMGEALSIPIDRKKDDAYLIVTAVNSYASSQAEIERLTRALEHLATSDLVTDNWVKEHARAALSGSKE